MSTSLTTICEHTFKILKNHDIYCILESDDITYDTLKKEFINDKRILEFKHNDTYILRQYLDCLQIAKHIINQKIDSIQKNDYSLMTLNALRRKLTQDIKSLESLMFETSNRLLVTYIEYKNKIPNNDVKKIELLINMLYEKFGTRFNKDDLIDLIDLVEHNFEINY